MYTNIGEMIVLKRWMLLLSAMLLSLLVVNAQNTNAVVINMWGDLNLRTAPSRTADIIVGVAGRTSLNAIGRTASLQWYLVQTPDGQIGWVSADYVDLIGVAPAALPVENSNAQTSSAPAPAESSAPPAESVAPVVVPDGASNGSVNVYALNVRAAPTRGAQKIGEVAFRQQVTIIARSANNSWLQVQTNNGVSGWVAARYISTDVALSALPVADGNAPVSAAVPAQNNAAPQSNVAVAPAGSAPYFTLGANAWNIRARGLETGKQANVFSKVGDSITASTMMYRPFGYGGYSLGGYGYLQNTINFYTQQSWIRNSGAAANGWTTAIVNNPAYAREGCVPGESPLACEYRVMQPAVALIMFGTNDMTNVDADDFANHLRTIVGYSANEGVIPVLSTIPIRRGLEGRTGIYNQIIVDVASQNGVSLWDYASVMSTLPDSGLSGDGVHPSEPPRGFDDAANFTDGFLKYGYVQRNLTALQVLDVIRAQVLQ